MGALATAVNQQPAPVSRKDTIRQLLNTNKAAIGMSLPRSMDADRFARLLLTAGNTNPDLFTCDPTSFLAAGVAAAQLGLEPNDARGLAYLVPFKDKRRGKIVQLIIGYRGMMDLARRSGMVTSINAFPVFEGDEFDYELGLRPTLRHVPGDHDEDPAKLTHVYAVAQIGGEPQFVVLTRRQIDKVRLQSQGGKSDYSPWNSGFFVEMAQKGLALDTPIPTPCGWTEMGRIIPGNHLFDSHGRQCRVTAVSEVKHLDCYRVTFGDGDTIVCDAEHLWVAKIANQTIRPRGIVEMYEAKQAGQAVTVPVAGPLDLPDAALPIDPWVLGYWLGNGRADGPVLTAHSDDADHVIAQITAAGYEVGTVRNDLRGKATSISILGVKHLFADLGVLGCKHVPADYLRGSADQRLAILRGLMDSDGSSANKRGRAVFGSTDGVLRDAVAELARSLGELVNIGQQESTGYGKTVTLYTAYWQPSTNPFSVSRKAGQVGLRKIAAYRTVTSIEKVPTVPTRCLAVDSPDHTFLAGVHMVPTHNTAIRRLCKFLPQTVEVAQALASDERPLQFGDLGMVAPINSDDSDGDELHPGAIDTTTGEITTGNDTESEPS